MLEWLAHSAINVVHSVVVTPKIVDLISPVRTRLDNPTNFYGSKMNCVECKFCVAEDYGYSNWTVEGTSVYCLLKLNPRLPADRWYGEADELKYASECKKFSKGEMIHIDVDRESGHMSNYTSDPEVKEILEKELTWSILKSQ